MATFNSTVHNSSYRWLRSIGNANRQSLRNLQFRLNAERYVATYYVRLLRKIARSTPNITRLALIQDDYGEASRALGHGTTKATLLPVEDLEDLLSTISRRENLSHLLIAGRYSASIVRRLRDALECHVSSMAADGASRLDYWRGTLWNKKMIHDFSPASIVEVPAGDDEGDYDMA